MAARDNESLQSDLAEALLVQKKLQQEIVNLQKQKANVEYEKIAETRKFDNAIAEYKAQINSLQAEKKRLSMTLDEKKEQERHEAYQTLQKEKEMKLNVELSEAQRTIQVLSVDLKHARQKLERLEQDREAVLQKVKTFESQNDTEVLKRTGLQDENKELMDQVAALKTKEKQLSKDVNDLREEKKSLEESYTKLKSMSAMDDLQMKKLQDRLQDEHYFSTLYKTRVKEEMEGKIQKVEELRQELSNLQDDKKALSALLEFTTTKAESEQLARQMAEDGLEEATQTFEKKVKDLISERDELNRKIEKISEELEKAKNDYKEEAIVSDKLRKQLEHEKMMKMEAINKLAEIMKEVKLTPTVEWKKSHR